MAISDLDTIEKSSVNTGEEFIVSLLLGTSIDATLISLA
jgi:hypothetical protein